MTPVRCDVLESGDDLDEVIALVIAQQRRRDRNVPSLGDTVAAVMAELGDLEPPWTETLRIVRAGDDVVGASFVDWDLDARRAWVHGPWIDVDDERWPTMGVALVEAVASQIPRAVTIHALSAVVEHRCMAELAQRLGWSASEVNHVLIVDAHTISTWPDTAHPGELRVMSSADVADIGPLHDAEFPDTYDSATALAARAAHGDQIVLVADHPDHDGIGGYVAGQIQPDGDGYIDYLAVAPSARGTGVARALVTALCRQLVPQTATQRVCLTVQSGRTPARRLYESLGFTTDSSMVGFERRHR